MRRWYRTDLIIVGLLIFVMVGPAAFAQMPGMGMGMGGGKGWGKHADNLDNLRMLKLLEMVELTEEQNVEFLTLFAAFRNEMKQSRKMIETEVDELIELLKNENPDEKPVKEKTDKIEELKLEHMASFSNLMEKSKEILTTVQYARMVVFQERFERELIKSVRGFRKGVTSGDHP